MIDKITIDKNPERVYRLSSIGLKETELVRGTETHIETPDACFPILDMNCFVVKENNISIKNEDDDELILTPEQFEVIKNILQGENSV